MYYSVRGIYLQKTLVKGSLTRDFRLQVFFMNHFRPATLSIPLGPIRIFYVNSQRSVYRRCRQST